MKIDDRHEIRIVVVTTDDTPREIFDNFIEFKKKHPYRDYTFGYIVYDIVNGCIPVFCNNWNSSPEEAINDYFDNVETCRIANFIQHYINEQEEAEVMHVDIVHTLLGFFSKEDLVEYGFADFIKDTVTVVGSDE